VRNVLVFHSGALGDFVLSWPLALALGRLFPQSRVVYVTAASKGRLAERLIGVESADVESGWHRLYSPDATLPDIQARTLHEAHTVFSFVAGPGDTWSDNVARLAPRAEICTIDPNPPADFAGHACDHLLNELSSWPTVRQAAEQMVRSLNRRGLPRAKPGARTVCIHPGSGSPAKCWPLERFAELGRRLVAAGRRVGFVVGEAELERLGREQIDLLQSIAPVSRPADYLELLGVLGESAVYIGNDSGPSHLAGVIALPTVCLFGPTKPEVWRPLGPHVQILHRQPLDGLTVDEVLAALPA